MIKGGVADGNVKPGRFVKRGTVAGHVAQAGAGERTCGISHTNVRNAAVPGWDDGYHAIAGEQVAINGNTVENAPLISGGVITPGAYLKSDSDGRGVVATTDKDEYGAIARTGATAANQLISVDVVQGQLSV